MKPVSQGLTNTSKTGVMTQAPTPLSPQGWLDDLFASKAARQGQVIRRKARDMERYAGWTLFRAEIERRGYRAVENSGQIVIFCNRAPVRPLFRSKPSP